MTKNRRFFDVYISWIITKMLDVTHRTRATTLCIWGSNKYTEIKEPLEYANYCKKNVFNDMFKKKTNNNAK